MLKFKLQLATLCCSSTDAWNSNLTPPLKESRPILRNCAFPVPLKLNALVETMKTLSHDSNVIRTRFLKGPHATSTGEPVTSWQPLANKEVNVQRFKLPEPRQLIWHRWLLCTLLVQLAFSHLSAGVRNLLSKVSGPALEPNGYQG